MANEIDATKELSFKVPAASQSRLAKDYGVQTFSPEEAAARETQINADVAQVRSFGQKLLTGELPSDVTEAVRKATAAGAVASGIQRNSSLARNLTARDLGKTSFDLMGMGAQTVQAISQFEEGRQQYRKQYSLASAQLAEQIRGTDLTEAQVGQAKYEFKNKMVLALNEQIIGLTTFREELQYKYAATDLQGNAGKAKGPLATVDNLLGQLRNSLAL